jgi:hypothetical protein
MCAPFMAHASEDFKDPLCSECSLGKLRAVNAMTVGATVECGCSLWCGLVVFRCGCQFTQAGDIWEICIGHHGLTANCFCSIVDGELSNCEIEEHRPACGCHPTMDIYCACASKESKTPVFRFDPFDGHRERWWDWRKRESPFPVPKPSRHQMSEEVRPLPSGSNYVRWLSQGVPRSKASAASPDAHSHPSPSSSVLPPLPTPTMLTIGGASSSLGPVSIGNDTLSFPTFTKSTWVLTDSLEQKSPSSSSPTPS